MDLLLEAHTYAHTNTDTHTHTHTHTHTRALTRTFYTDTDDMQIFLDSFIIQHIRCTYSNAVLRSYLLGLFDRKKDRERHTPPQCCLTLGILSALPPATSNYKGIASKTELVSWMSVLTPFTLPPFSYDFLWRILNIFKTSNFYILAVKEVGSSATCEK